MNFDSVKMMMLSNGETVEYGIINGDRNIVVIKAGAGGSYSGYENKYLKMARLLHNDSGCTVICASNATAESFEKADVEVIRDVIAKFERGIKLYYIGVSNGAVQGLLSATQYFDFQRMILINMPLMINFHKTKEALTRVKSDILFIYGEKDPSHFYIPFLRNASNSNTCMAQVEIEVVHQANHYFAGMLDTFVDLGKKVFETIDN